MTSVGAGTPPTVGVLWRRVLAGSAELAQVWFEAAVLETYRTAPGHKIIRTNSVGRVRGPQWTLDFGIAGDDEGLIHVGAGDLDRIPEAERAHWAAHARSLPLSANFVAMQLTRGACIDDGDVRPW